MPGSGPSSRPSPTRSMSELAQALIRGERRALARAVTLVESTLPQDRQAAETLLQELLPHSGQAVRLGLSGPPGVGKSTFIEALGLHLIAAGHRVAVLAIDPSSRRSGGSILGDKTRMEQLSRHPAAFIRPSPSGGSLGGVARRTREVMTLVEAAGYDVVMIETVGVGQSETAVADLADALLLLLPPAGGDELQGIKKGIVELADLAVINKADGALLPAAKRAQAEYQSALRLLHPASGAWVPPVLLASALEAKGMAEVWQSLEGHRAFLGAQGLAEKRAAQARRWLWQEVEAGLREAFLADPDVAAMLPRLEGEVAAGVRTSSAAASELLRRLKRSS